MRSYEFKKSIEASVLKDINSIDFNKKTQLMKAAYELNLKEVRRRLN